MRADDNLIKFKHARYMRVAILNMLWIPVLTGELHLKENSCTF